MRVTDIETGSRPMKHDMTPELYIPIDRVQPIPLEELPPAILRRGMCAKSRGELVVCHTCTGGCAYGRTLMLMASGSIPTPTANPRARAAIAFPQPEPADKPAEELSVGERVEEAHRRLDAGETREQVAEALGYKSWRSLAVVIARVNGTDTLPDWAKGKGVSPNPANAAALQDGLRRAKALLHDLDAGMEREEAARQHGWKSWKQARNYLNKRKTELAAAKEESA